SLGDYSGNPNALVGKKVTAKGYVKLYGTTYEMPYFAAASSPTGADYTPQVTAIDDEGGGTTPEEPQDKVENKTYTVDELLAAMSNYADKQISGVECTVKGVATSAEYNSKHLSYTIWLQSDDGTNAKAFELYSVGMNAEAGNYSENPEGLVGKTVTCTGYVQLYGTTYEMPFLSAKNSPTGEAYTPAITAVEKAGGDEPEPLKEFYTPDELVALMADYADQQVSKEIYTVKGVASSSRYGETFGSYTVWLQSEDGTVEQKFELFSVGLDAGVEGDYKAENALKGKTITCSGYLRKFVDKNNTVTYEMSYLDGSISPSGAAYTPSITAVEGGTEPENPDPENPDPEEPGVTTSVVKVAVSELGFSNQEAVPSITAENVVITFDKGTNNNPPKYYTSGAAIRAYGSNTITFTTNDGSKITEIVFTFGEYDSENNPLSVDVGTFDVETNKWTGDAEKVVFTVGGTKGNRRLSAFDITTVK
ncbi:MAG: hypothetical protein IKI54_05590, partial [Lachnospiraceae bacterium]|nr:hypothetical protein [Lachnospiraceae bacterium]